MSRLLGGAVVCAAVCIGWAAPASAARLDASPAIPPDDHLGGLDIPARASYSLDAGESSSATFRMSADRHQMEVHEWGRARVLLTAYGPSPYAPCVAASLFYGTCFTDSPMELSVSGGSGHDTFDARALPRGPSEVPYFDDEWYLGSGGADTVLGSAEDDLIEMGWGRDLIVAGGGRDKVIYRWDADVASGVRIVHDAPGRARELTKGDRLDDVEVFGGTPGDDEFAGASGAETFVGGGIYEGGVDLARGGAGPDDLDLGAGAAFGEDGDDVLASSGSATLDGGPGNDTLQRVGRGSSSPLHGGDGDDLLEISATSSGAISCGAGVDTLRVTGWRTEPLPTVPPDCEQLVDQRR